MALEHRSGTVTGRSAGGGWLPASPSVTDESPGIQEADTETDSRFYPPGFDYYRDIVAKNPPSGLLGIPHRETGDLVTVDLFVVSEDELVEMCGIPDHQREAALDCYRTYLLGRIPHWDKHDVPNHIPLLDE